MHWVRRRSTRVVVALFCLSVLALITLSLGHGLPGDSAEPASGEQQNGPELRLQYGRQNLQMTITSTSPEHEEAILQILRDEFPGMQVRVDFRTGLTGYPQWPNSSARLLQLVAMTVSAEVSVRDGVAQIRGASIRPADYQQRLRELQDVLPTNFKLQSDVLAIPGGATSKALCARSFQALADAAIRFHQSSTEFRNSAYPALDRLAAFAYDCPDSTVAIIGHTDATGDESWNLQLSQARAQAVANYLSDNGLEPSQFVIEGRGSSEPVGDNSTVVGRERNRRIELELR